MKKKDINIKIEDYLLNCRAVAIIINNNKILFQKRKNDKYWALPGGKISVGETTKITIERELKEELGIKNFQVKDVCLVAEHFFTFKNEKVHQYIFGHQVFIEKQEYILNETKFKGIEPEKDLIFEWFNTNELNKVSIKPDFLKQQLKNINKIEVQFTSYQEK